MSSREDILHRVRTALGRPEGGPPPAPRPVRLRIPETSLESRMASMIQRIEALAGRVVRVPTPAEAGAWVRRTVAGKQAVVSQAPFLAECGIRDSEDPRELRERCAAAEMGITSADYALADTGTLVLLSSPREARLISLLPPAHIAVVPCNRLLSGLEELFSVLPDPAAAASSMVLITGPSRTADIEQILVRGVHGPGQITAVLVG